MAIVNADAKSLEIYCVAYLSQDEVLLKELADGADIHSLNQTAFNLPSRLIAKVLVFRIIYGGSAFSFANDPDFRDTSTSEKYWQSVIDKFYDKYKGIARWHTSIVQEVIKNKRLVMPTGREYTYEMKLNYAGISMPPVTTIKNYPVNISGLVE